MNTEIKTLQACYSYLENLVKESNTLSQDLFDLKNKLEPSTLQNIPLDVRCGDGSIEEVPTSIIELTNDSLSNLDYSFYKIKHSLLELFERFHSSSAKDTVQEYLTSNVNVSEFVETNTLYINIINVNNISNNFLNLKTCFNILTTILTDYQTGSSLNEAQLRELLTLKGEEKENAISCPIEYFYSRLDSISYYIDYIKTKTEDINRLIGK